VAGDDIRRLSVGMAGALAGNSVARAPWQALLRPRLQWAFRNVRVTMAAGVADDAAAVMAAGRHCNIALTHRQTRVAYVAWPRRSVGQAVDIGMDG